MPARATLFVVLISAGVCADVVKSFLQSAQQKDSILLFVSDEDDRQQVALDFSDTVTYATQRPATSTQQSESPGGQPFMTGDVFNNGRTDSLKLEISAVDAKDPLNWADLRSDKGLQERYRRELQRRGYDFQDLETYTDFERAYLFTSGDFAPEPLDSDDSVLVESPDRLQLLSVGLLGSINRVIGDRYEYTDEDDVVVLYSEDGYDDLRGDASDNDRSDEIVLNVRREFPPSIAPLDNAISSSGFNKTVEDVDDYSLVFTDGEVYSVSYSDLHPLRTADIDYPEPPLSQGKRLSRDDLTDVPILFSTDSSEYMTGDRFDNNRTDSEQLTIVQLDPVEIDTQPEPYFRVESVEVADIENTDFELIAEFHEHPERAVLTESIPFYTGKDSDMMVGDLFDNGRTDRSQLTIVQVVPQEAVEEPVEIEEPVGIPVAEIHMEEIDLDEFEQQPEEESPEEEAMLDCQAPENYVSGDFFDNDECDFSRLVVNVLRPRTRPAAPPTPVVFPTATISADTDESWDYTFTFDGPPVPPVPSGTPASPPPPHDQLERLTLNQKFIKDMGIANEVRGERRAFLDNEKVPLFYSSDTTNYLAGDMYDNKRTDTSKLRVILSSGESLKWAETQSVNPGFLQ